MSPSWVPDTKTHWPTDRRRSITLTLIFNSEYSLSRKARAERRLVCIVEGRVAVIILCVQSPRLNLSVARECITQGIWKLRLIKGKKSLVISLKMFGTMTDRR
jgi:hypothetical protein